MPQSEQRLRSAAVSAVQFSQTHVVRSLVIVLMVSPLRGVLPTVGSCCDAGVTPRLPFGGDGFGGDEFRGPARSYGS